MSTQSDMVKDYIHTLLYIRGSRYIPLVFFPLINMTNMNISCLCHHPTFTTHLPLDSTSHQVPATHCRPLGVLSVTIISPDNSFWQSPTSSPWPTMTTSIPTTTILSQYTKWLHTSQVCYYMAMIVYYVPSLPPPLHCDNKHILIVVSSLYV